jgi:hypothetical protein
MLVADPFVGNGTTSQAAMEMGRRFFCSQASLEAQSFYLAKVGLISVKQRGR